MSDVLLDAILAAPADDAPRLVYADTLTERGDPQGELIVVQCELARLLRSDRRRAQERELQLFVRERELRERELLRLQAAIPDARITLERGFIARIDIAPLSLRRSWPLLVRQPLTTIALAYGSVDDLAFAASHPTVQTLRITDMRRHVTSKATLDAAAVRALPTAETEQAWTSADLPHADLFGAVTSVTLTNPTLETLERLRLLPILADLTFTGPYGLSPKEAEGIGKLTSLTRFVATGWSPEITRAFLESPPPPKLRDLDVRRNPDNVLSKVAALPQLESLATNMRLDKALCAQLGNLRGLFLEETPAGGFFVPFLAAAPKLERVRLHSGSHRPTLADQLPTFPPLPALREVELSSFSVDEDSARALIRQLGHVHALDIRKSYFDGQARAVLLAQWPTARFAWGAGA